MDQSGSPGKRVAWKPSMAQRMASTDPLASRGSSVAPSRANSRPNSPPSSVQGSMADLPGELMSMERPAHKRTRSKFSWQSVRPRYHRSKSSAHPNHPHVKPAIAESAVPSAAIAKLAQRTNNNLRMWFLRHNNGGASRRRTETEKLREIQSSRLLFSQAFAVTPMVLIAASSLQPEEGYEKKVPVVLQQLTIRVSKEHAKHYRNMMRIHLEYGSGLGTIRWEIVRGFRDLLYLRAKLKASSKTSIRSKKVKLPKLPRPKYFGLKESRKHGGGLSHISEEGDGDEEEDEEDSEVDEALFAESSSDEEDGEEVPGARTTTAGSSGGVGATSVGATSVGATSVGATSVGATSIGAATAADGFYDAPADPTSPGGASMGSAGDTSTHGVGVGGSIRSGQASTRSDSNRHAGRPPMSRASSHQRGRGGGSGSGSGSNKQKQSFAAAVEAWLNRIKYIYSFRPDTNDLMRFLEFSHLSLKLAAEYSFHGKEGTVLIRSRASEMGWQVNHWHPRDFKDMVERHTKKWLLVRDSYLVIVDSIYSTRIREVFYLDSKFRVKHISEEQGNRVTTAIQNDDVDGVVEALPEAQNVHKRKGAKSIFLHLINNERELKLAATSERDLRRWQASILQMKARSPWSKPNRFGSYAPVRKNVFGQWFVDGRDYMWVLSEALENARDTIFILDWWLSPELYLRRPPEGNQKWRLDRVLKRKAQQGVKIFVIVYRNVGPTIPIDSLWTKHSLIDLHDNIHVMRSPNQLSNKSSLFWAHHEKLCIIDNTVAFNGGIDLCFGRWDTWEHTLTDDFEHTFLPKDPSPEEWQKKTQLFPGKDYSNARVKDFYELNRPFEDMYDRNQVPRMPWHDIHQMVVGQPARDFARHFVQRWNYVLRQKIPSRPTPLLLPPADFSQEDLERLQLTGTCEYQCLRSSGEWSLGLKEHEQSIQNAYLQLIEESEHFVYIENQFFITSTEVDGVLIENQIGNALVQRIVRAHENGEAWRAFILIPLMPGFEAEVDTDKASSVRVICQCQFNSISRGPNSIFYRLESLGIMPEQYISFFSLRKWGKFSSENGGRIASELLYIHAKCMIVDDRVAIIGSANINERSMRGVRDSEVAVCVRDTKVVESKMAGKPWKAAKFAHSLRKRLMREHLGVNIDKLEIIDRIMDSLDATAERARDERQRRAAAMQSPRRPSYEPTSSNSTTTTAAAASAAAAQDPIPPPEGLDEFPEWLYPELHSFNWYAGTSINRGVRDYKKFSSDSRVKEAAHREDVDGEGEDHWKARQSQEEKVKEKVYAAAEPDIAMEKEAREILQELIRDKSITSRDEFKKIFYSRFAKQDILRPLKRAADIPMPHTDEDGLRAVNNENIPIDPWAFDDPLDDRFVHDRWMAAAERNTLIFRLVFRVQPDDEVETWKDYKTFVGHLERFYEKQREDGGPDALRRSGHHEPERVDKYVLDGSIKQQDPETLRRTKLRASQPNHSPSSSERRQDMTSFEGRLNEARYRDNLWRSVLEDERRQRHPDESSHDSPQHGAHESQDPNSHQHHHKLRRHRHWDQHGGSPLQHIEDPLHRLRIGKKHGKDEEGYFDFDRGDFPNAGSEFTATTDKAKTPHLGPSMIDEHANGSANGSAYTNGTANGTTYGSANGTANGSANGVPDELQPRRRSHQLQPNLSNLPEDGDAETQVSADQNVFRDQPENGSGTVTFPEIPGSAEQSGQPQSIRPSVSGTSARRRTMTNISSAASMSKPARKWGHFEHVLDALVAEDMLQGVTGHLVVFPTEWLNRELDSGNWNFHFDLIAPLEIYD